MPQSDVWATSHKGLILLLSSSISGMVLPPGYSLWLFLLKPFMWCHSDARLWHACYLFRYIFLYLFDITYSYITCLHASELYLYCCDWRHEYKIFLAHHCNIIPMFIMFASTFKVLTGLSLAIVLARFLAWRGVTVMTAPEPTQWR